MNINYSFVQRNVRLHKSAVTNGTLTNNHDAHLENREFYGWAVKV